MITRRQMKRHTFCKGGRKVEGERVVASWHKCLVRCMMGQLRFVHDLSKPSLNNVYMIGRDARRHLDTITGGGRERAREREARTAHERKGCIRNTERDFWSVERGSGQTQPRVSRLPVIFLASSPAAVYLNEASKSDGKTCEGVSEKLGSTVHVFTTRRYFQEISPGQGEKLFATPHPLRVCRYITVRAR